MSTTETQLREMVKIAKTALEKIYAQNHKCLCECSWTAKDALHDIESKNVVVLSE